MEIWQISNIAKRICGDIYWLVTDIEVKSKADLTQLVGDASTAGDLYRQWIANAVENRRTGQLCYGLVVTTKAIEGVGFLGITGRGATKFETYTCMVIMLLIHSSTKYN